MQERVGTGKASACLLSRDHSNLSEGFALLSSVHRRERVKSCSLVETLGDRRHHQNAGGAVSVCVCMREAGREAGDGKEGWRHDKGDARRKAHKSLRESEITGGESEWERERKSEEMRLFPTSSFDFRLFPLCVCVLRETSISCPDSSVPLLFCSRFSFRLSLPTHPSSSLLSCCSRAKARDRECVAREMR